MEFIVLLMAYSHYQKGTWRLCVKKKENKMRKKLKQKNPSLAVIRAIARLNNYAHQKTAQSVVWDGKSITQYLSVTS